MKTCIKTILSLILDEDNDICKQLQSELLAIWRGEIKYSPVACELSAELIKLQAEKFKNLLTENEQVSLGLQVAGSPVMGKDQVRTGQICFICQEGWL